MSGNDAVGAIRSFNRFYTNVIGVVDRNILDSPFSLTEVRILWEIHHNRDRNARKIRAALQVDEGYLSRTISKLLRQGLIRKDKSTTDKRVFRLSLTENGEETFLELNRRAGEAIRLMIHGLTAGEVSQIVSHMREIERILSKGATWQ